MGWAVRAARIYAFIGDAVQGIPAIYNIYQGERTWANYLGALPMVGHALGALGKLAGLWGCFEAGTQVVVGVNPDGSYVTRNIEDLQAGDFVLSRSATDANDTPELRQITAVPVHTVNHLRVLTIRDGQGNEQVIKTTDEHPFYVPGTGWVRAGDLVAGQQLSEADGTTDATILATAREEHPEGIKVYNLSVGLDHTFYVADAAGSPTAVWVHNTYSVTLGNALGGRKYMNALGYAAHHIIPRRLDAANDLRTHLRSLGIRARDLDRAWNGVWVKHPLPHLNMHTPTYIRNLVSSPHSWCQPDV